MERRINETEHMRPDYPLCESSSSNCMVVFDETCRILAVRRPASLRFGLEDEELLGQRPPFDWCPEGQREVLDKLIRFVTTKRALEFEGVKVRLALTSPSGFNSEFDCCFRKLSDGNTAVFWKPVPPELPENRIQQALDLLRSTIEVPGAAHFVAGLESGAIGNLSRRERQVFIMLVKGLRVAEIARELYLSAETVRNHRKAIYEKLSVRSQVELIVKFRRYSVPADGL